MAVSAPMSAAAATPYTFLLLAMQWVRLWPWCCRRMCTPQSLPFTAAPVASAQGEGPTQAVTVLGCALCSKQTPPFSLCCLALTLFNKTQLAAGFQSSWCVVAFGADPGRQHKAAFVWTICVMLQAALGCLGIRESAGSLSDGCRSSGWRLCRFHHGATVQPAAPGIVCR